MKQEHQELLIKDLSGRSLYGVKFRYKYIDEFFHEKYGTSTLEGVLPPYHIIHSTLVGEEYLQIEKDEVKPYLFPLSSMTEEQKKEEYEIYKYYLIGYESKLIDFYHKNHLDYRGLIPMGLALDATGLDIY